MNEDMKEGVGKIDTAHKVLRANHRASRRNRFHFKKSYWYVFVQGGQIEHWTETAVIFGDREKVGNKTRGGRSFDGFFRKEGENFCFDSVQFFLRKAWNGT